MYCIIIKYLHFTIVFKLNYLTHYKNMIILFYYWEPIMSHCWVKASPHFFKSSQSCAVSGHS